MIEMYEVDGGHLRYKMGLQSIIQRWKNQVPFTNKTDYNDITEIYLQVVLNTINQNPSTLYISIIKNQLYTKPSKHDM
jgi:hypothetical protein